MFHSQCLKFFILVKIVVQSFEFSLEARPSRFRANRKNGCSLHGEKVINLAETIDASSKDKPTTIDFPLQKNERKNPIENVIIATKHNHDFEYLPTIFRSIKGEKFALNQIGENKYQRYVIHNVEENGNENIQMSGIYAIIILNESLKNWMGHATITVKFICYGSLKKHILSFPVEIRNVSDDRQIFIFLDPNMNNRKKFVAWEITLQDTDQNLTHSKANYIWEIFIKNN